MYKLVSFLAVVAFCSGEPSIGLEYAPLGYAAYGPLPYSAPVSYAAPLAYAAPWSSEPALPRGQPATVIKANGVPVDTVDVVASRAQHYTAKVLNGGYHLLKKRSVGHAVVATAPIVAARTFSAPLHAPVVPAFQPYSYGTLPAFYNSYHLLKKRSITHAVVGTAPIVAARSFGYAGVVPAVQSYSYNYRSLPTVYNGYHLLKKRSIGHAVVATAPVASPLVRGVYSYGYAAPALVNAPGIYSASPSLAYTTRVW